MNKYLTSAFSLSMLNQFPSKIDVRELTESDFEGLKKNEYNSAIGHESTVTVINQLLQTNYKSNRIQVSLNTGDIVVVFQLLDRLPEAKILSAEELQTLRYKFLLVEVL